jgi:hypothetical protein
MQITFIAPSKNTTRAYLKIGSEWPEIADDK